MPSRAAGVDPWTTDKAQAQEREKLLQNHVFHLLVCLGYGARVSVRVTHYNYSHLGLAVG